MVLLSVFLIFCSGNNYIHNYICNFGRTLRVHMRDHNFNRPVRRFIQHNIFGIFCDDALPSGLLSIGGRFLPTDGTLYERLPNWVNRVGIVCVEIRVRLKIQFGIKFFNKNPASDLICWQDHSGEPAPKSSYAGQCAPLPTERNATRLRMVQFKNSRRRKFLVRIQSVIAAEHDTQGTGAGNE